MVEYWQVAWFIAMFAVMPRMRIPTSGLKWWLGACVTGGLTLVWFGCLTLKFPSATAVQWLLGPGIFVSFIFGGYLHVRQFSDRQRRADT